MTMHQARMSVMLFGIVLPYLACLPRGTSWLMQYVDTGLGGFLFFSLFNAIAWGSIVALSFLFRRPASLLAAVALGSGYLAWSHYRLDLSADAQAALGLVFIPIHALLPITMGTAIGFAVDRYVIFREAR